MHSFSTNVLICTLSTVNMMATNIIITSAFKEHWVKPELIIIVTIAT